MVVIRYEARWSDNRMIPDDDTVTDVEFGSGAQVAKLSNLNTACI
jgi:hypothetical protein